MWVEVVCILALLFGFIKGWLNGLTKELLSMGGFLVGLAIAYYYHKTIGCTIWVFLIITLAAPIVLGWIATLLNKLLDKVFLVGFLNHLLGAIVGCVKWGLLIGFILLMIEKIEEWRSQLPDIGRFVHEFL